MRDTLFQRACRHERVPRAPVWLMRQAGRYMKVYRDLKEQHGFLGICESGELAAQATLDAARYLETDAAIIFSDITLPAARMGVPLTFDPGPVFAEPIRDSAAVKKLKNIDPNVALESVMDAIRMTREGLPDSSSLIGFAGAPLTLASYLIEGRHDKHWRHFKQAVYQRPAWFDELLERLADMVAAHLQAQLDAGCDAVQLFDTQAGEVSAEARRAIAFPIVARIMEQLNPKDGARIYFARNITAQLGEASQLPIEVLGVDWGVSLKEADALVRQGVTLMGNLDPGCLFTDDATISGEAKRILREGFLRDGYVFNLGHGVLPGTDPERVKNLVSLVKSTERHS